MPDSSRRVLDEADRRAPRLNIRPTGIDGAEVEPYYDGIGAELRAERMRNGLSLETVAQRLRIRLSHLEAIEDGRFGDLPGRIYAIGFLRSYAEFLGADGDVCISLFKAEVGPDGHSRRLTFPVPPDERRRPGWVTLMVSLLLAGAVYGGWYALQGGDSPDVAVVPAVPERFVEQGAQADRRAARIAERSAATDTTLGAQAAETRDVAATVEVKAPEAPEPIATTPVQSIDLAVVGRATPEIADPIEQAAPAVTDVAAPAEAETPAEEVVRAVEATEPVAEAAEETITLAAVAPPPPVPVVAAENNGYVPRVLGISNRDSRVTVRAVDTAQIIVKQAGGGTLLPHRVLKPGDSYRAPNREGVILQSANIAGLEILVDGRVVGRADVLAAPADALSLDADLLASLAN